MKEIKLSQGYVAIVDDEDYERVAKYNWHAVIQHRLDLSTRVYAARGIRKADGKFVKGYLHRLISGTPEGMDTDHINGDSLDNRRCNLRSCTTAENARNRPRRISSESRFKGVSRVRGYDRWRAYIKRDGVKKHIGYFDSEEDAARAYNNYAVLLHGEFSRINAIAEVE